VANFWPNLFTQEDWVALVENWPSILPINVGKEGFASWVLLAVPTHVNL
jgi:hypothetical protein